MGSFCSRDNYDIIPDDGETSARKSCCGCTTKRVIIIVIIALVLLGPFIPRLLWKRACLVGLRDSGFSLLDTPNYHLWYNNNSILQLAQSGKFTGPEQMTEYVDFIQATFFRSNDFSEPKIVPIVATKDTCEVLVAAQDKAQVKPEYSVTGEGQCLITTVGFKLYFTVNDLNGNGFNIKRTNLFYPEKFLNILFNNVIGGPGVTDYICDDVLRDVCHTVYAENDLNEEKCKSMYESLPPTDDYGYLDDYTKGCRILHSAFAQINKKHCPHMSFIPIPDYTGELWCQKSGGVKATDLFTPRELKSIKDFAIESGFDPISLSTNCTYGS